MSFHGVFSLLMATAAWLIGMAAIFSLSFFWGMVYTAIFIASFITIIWAYCCKCPARNVCSHYFPGKITKLLPKRKTEPYAMWEIITMLSSFSALTFFPQYWLWQNKILFIVFWVLMIEAVTEIRCRVCPGCKNIYCILKGKRK